MDHDKILSWLEFKGGVCLIVGTWISLSYPKVHPSWSFSSWGLTRAYLNYYDILIIITHFIHFSTKLMHNKVFEINHLVFILEKRMARKMFQMCYISLSLSLIYNEFVYHNNKASLTTCPSHLPTCYTLGQPIFFFFKKIGFVESKATSWFMVLVTTDGRSKKKKKVSLRTFKSISWPLPPPSYVQKIQLL